MKLPPLVVLRLYFTFYWNCFRVLRESVIYFGGDWLGLANNNLKNRVLPKLGEILI